MQKQLPQEFLEIFPKQDNYPDQYSIGFLTNIKFENKEALLASKPDFVTQFYEIDLSKSPEDLLKEEKEVSFFSEGFLPVADCNYGQLAVCLLENDFGAIYYAWKHYPSAAWHFDNKRNELEKKFKDDPQKLEQQMQFFDVEKIADSLTDFFQSKVLNEEKPELSTKKYPIYNYKKEDIFQQTKRQACLYNIFMLTGSSPDEKQQKVIENISSGFISQKRIDKIKQEIEDEPQLYIFGSFEEDDFIFERMLDILMLNKSLDKRQYDICLYFMLKRGFPSWEMDRSVSDYYAKRKRERNRQAPGFLEMMEDARENALAVTQSLFIICLKNGGVTPEQNELFMQFNGENELKQGEIKYLIYHVNDLGFSIPRLEGWQDTLKEMMPKMIKAGEPLNNEAYELALKLWSLLGGTKATLDEVLK